jgi:hypothetical protein
MKKESSQFGTAPDADLSRRVSELEEKVTQLDKSLAERHIKFITIIFGSVAVLVAVCALCVTGMGMFSRNESRDATKEMKTEVKESVQDMQRRFELLAGESLKKPVLQIASAGGLLDGQVFEFPSAQGGQQFGTLFIKNTGDKRSDPLSIRLYCSEGATVNGGNWVRTPTQEKDFPNGYYLMGVGNLTVSQGETWSLEETFWIYVAPSATNAFCKVQLFGGEKPVESRFQLRRK